MTEKISYQKTNYQLELDRVLAALKNEARVPTLMLHACCAPCSSYVLEYLTEYFDITVLYYNPNTKPEAEYNKRGDALRYLIANQNSRYGLRLIESEWDGERFDAIAAGRETEAEGGSRCVSCYTLRIAETARYALTEGSDYFCTTLSVSPHKDARRINEIGRSLESEGSALWLPSDFKKRGGYNRSIELSHRLNLYRQNYCGCLSR